MKLKSIYTILFGISAVMVTASLVALVMFGLRFGVDFKGGSVLEVSFTQRPQLEEVQGAFSTVKDLSISPAGDHDYIIRTVVLPEQDHQKMLEMLNAKFPQAGMQEVRFDSVGPVIGNELKTKSIKAVILVLLGIIIYVAIVFRRVSRSLSPWVMGVGVLAALAHDIVIPLGVFAVLGHYYNIEISAVFVAAILTVLGYSISDTVVVFDRVRENIVRGSLKDGLAEVVDKSVRQTIVRSINTNITTLLSLIAIYFFGGESIKYFALALIIGIAMGALSSISVASPLLVWLSSRRQ